MNIRVRLVMFLCAALSCGARAAENKLNNNSPINPPAQQLPVQPPVELKKEEPKSEPKKPDTGELVIGLLSAKSKVADIAIATLLVQKVWDVIFHKRGYAGAIFWGAAAVLRAESMLETCKYVSSASGGGLSTYSGCLVSNPKATLALTAMVITGACILQDRIGCWWNNVKLKLHGNIGLDLFA